MSLLFRNASGNDMPFLRQMLYEAVYWRSITTKDNPPVDEGLAAPGVLNALDGWDEREGDTAMIAVSDLNPAGAAWYRFYRISNAIRGYIDEITPVLVLAVAPDYRRRGIGTRLLTGLIEHASENGIHRLSLMVTNDNHAYALYKRCGFRVYTDGGDSHLMIREL